MGFVSTLAICVIAIVIVIGVVIIKNGLASEAGGFSKKIISIRRVAPKIILQHDWQNAIQTLIVKVDSCFALLLVDFERNSIGLVYEDEKFEIINSIDIINVYSSIDNQDGIINDINLYIDLADKRAIVVKFLHRPGNINSSRVQRLLTDANNLYIMINDLKAS